MLEFSKSTPEEVGIPSGAVLELLAQLEKYQLPMHSILLMRKDKLVFEGYYNPCKSNSLHRMFSISKSITAIAIGCLEQEGKIDLDRPAISYFPEYASENLHPWITQMTIRDMLQMKTCHASTTYKLRMKEDWVESFFLTPPDHKPGTIFHYDTSSAHTLCALVEKLSGKPILDYLREGALKELELSKEAYFLQDPFGVSMGGSGLMATSLDLLKIGYLLLHRGKINGKQLLKETFLEEALSLQSVTAVTGMTLFECQGYGYQIWQGQAGSFLCYGMGGQFIFCLPKEEFLCVTTADTQGIQGGNQLFFNALFEKLIAKLSDEKLSVEQKQVDDLRKREESLELAPLSSQYAEQGAKQGEERNHGKCFAMEKNAKGFEECRLLFSSEKDGCFEYIRNGERGSISFGRRNVKKDIFPEYGFKCASSGIWMNENLFVIRTWILDTACSSVTIELYFGEEDVTIYMKKTDEMQMTEFNCHLYGHLKG